MSVKQRLIEFAKSQEKSVRAFEANCGLTIGYINAIRVSISPEKLQSIALHYPQLNAGWVFTGDGEMLKSGVEVKRDILQDESEIIKQLVDMNRILQLTIDNQAETIKGMQRTIDYLQKSK